MYYTKCKPKNNNSIHQTDFKSGQSVYNLVEQSTNWLLVWNQAVMCTFFEVPTAEIKSEAPQQPDEYYADASEVPA